MPRSASPRSKPDWVSIVAPYQRADPRQAWWQVVNTFVPFFAGWYLAWRCLSVSYWLTLAIAVVLAGLMVRIFIIQHDCGHGSFLPSRAWNDRLGAFCSLFTFTPYLAWRHDHSVHHATSGNLDHRGTGDIKTLTVDEYLGMSRWQRLLYRAYRHPLILFVVGPIVLFVILQRIPYGLGPDGGRERQNILLTNLALLAVYVPLIAAVGWHNFWLIQLPLTLIACSTGVWLFYVQHQFDEAYWVHDPDWEYSLVALQGSSYYRLPRVLQWFTGNIGLHHVHHLSPRIPNYRLQACHDQNPIFWQAKVMTFWDSLKTIPLALWDEQHQRLIRFRDLATRPAAPLGIAA